MATVTWTQDVNGNFEVSSPDHLKQLMQKGTLYTDEGSFPADYWGSGVQYIQTTNIDLLGDSTDITPIGLNADRFFGDYDGGGYNISNWFYLDPEFNTSGNPIGPMGLFGYIVDCTLKNIRLTGVCRMNGFTGAAGLVCGTANGSTTRIINIECDLAEGSQVYQGDRACSYTGGMFGLVSGCAEVTGCTIKGHLDFSLDTFVPVSNVLPETRLGSGGVSGGIINVPSVRFIQNIATFQYGIFSRDAGGLFGKVSGTMVAFNNCINAMIGDVTGQDTVGGISGESGDSITDNSHHTLINAMTGNIRNASFGGSSYQGDTGGIFGMFHIDSSAHSFVNYMSGDIVRDFSNDTGCIAGVFSTSLGSLSSSMVAMNGDCNDAVTSAFINSAVDSGAVTIEVTVDFTFGLIHSSGTGNDFVTSNPPGGAFLTDSGFPELPYLPIGGTDTEGNVYDFDFVYANLGGNATYNSHTHLVLHKGDIATPFGVDFDVPENNTTTYLTFVNYLTLVVVQPGLVIIIPPEPLALDARSINIPIVIAEVPGAIGYNVTYQGPTGGEITALSGVTTLEHNIVGVAPGTMYTIRLYTDTGAGYVLTEELVTTTLPNLAENYDVADLLQNGVIELSSLPDSSVANINEIIDDLLNTGERVSVSVTSKITSFINLGDQLDVTELDGVLLPFSENSTAGQEVNVVISNNTTVGINYDETVNSITINGVEYFPGDTFILDGKKVTVIDY